MDFGVPSAARLALAAVGDFTGEERLQQFRDRDDVDVVSEGEGTYGEFATKYLDVYPFPEGERPSYLSVSRLSFEVLTTFGYDPYRIYVFDVETVMAFAGSSEEEFGSYIEQVELFLADIDWEAIS